MKNLGELFDFKGVSPRAEYWAINVGGWFFLVVIGAITAGLVGAFGSAGALVGLLILPIVVAIAAVDVRRLHDRGKSGWWMILFWLIPFVLSLFAAIMSYGGADTAAAASVFRLPAFVLSIWALVELGFLGAAKGPNKYNGRVDTTVAKVFD